MRHELAIALRSRLCWLQAALSALLVGHGFVLALDIYGSLSRSALDGTLMRREVEPLAGLVRPTLGGLELALSLLGPLAAVRSLAIEKERRTFGARLLLIGSAARVLAAKYLAALLAVLTQFLAPLALLALWLGLGGHLGGAETACALLGYALFAAAIAALGTAAAAWTDSLAQAATATVLVLAASWAIDAAEGFAALAWMGRALDWSIGAHLAPFTRGILNLGACAWLLALAAGALALAWLGVRPDLGPARRAVGAIGAVTGTALVLGLCQHLPYAFDLTEDDRASLPPAAVAGLRRLPGPIELEVYLDRDDDRRTQLERDALSKLRLARPALHVRYPLDERPASAGAEHDEGYNRIVVRAGGRQMETRSTSRKELTSLIFEASGQQLPDWSQPEYPGYPLALEGVRRSLALACAYLIFPAGLALLGWQITRSRRRNP